MNGTFGRCYNLETAPLLPDTVEDMTITFYHCESLKSVQEIPKNVKFLTSTFINTKLVTVPDIPSNVVSLRQTFYNCTELENVSIIIPNTVERIDNMFLGCSKLHGIITVYANIKEEANYLYFLANANKSTDTDQELEIRCTEEIYNLYYDETQANKLNKKVFGYSDSNIKLTKIENRN